MQAPSISIKNLTLNIHSSPKAAMPALAVLSAALAAGGAMKAETTELTDIPAVGQAWPGQGGINGGLVPARGDVAAHYLIIAAADIGDHEWGGCREESKATSKTDGKANTAVLIEGNHPAAKAAANYTADNHCSFYLPSAAELYHCWVNCPEVFAQDCYYWSSSQRSAYYAFTMDFGVGTQDFLDKYGELSVRPVRRLFI